jgi:hypothetical protein
VGAARIIVRSHDGKYGGRFRTRGLFIPPGNRGQQNGNPTIVFPPAAYKKSVMVKMGNLPASGWSTTIY